MTTTRKDNRHGKHREELVQIAGYVTPELKALAQVTANELHTNMMDLIRDGIATQATRAGIMRNGEVVEKYKPIIAAYVDVFRARKAANNNKKENAK